MRRIRQAMKSMAVFEEGLSPEERIVFWLGLCFVVALAVLGFLHATVSAFS